MRRTFGWILYAIFFPVVFLWQHFKSKPIQPKVAPDEEMENWYKARAKGATVNRDVVDILADLLPDDQANKIIYESEPQISHSLKYTFPDSKSYAEYKKARGAHKLVIKTWSQDPLNPKHKIRNNWIRRWMKHKDVPINLKDPSLPNDDINSI